MCEESKSEDSRGKREKEGWYLEIGSVQLQEVKKERNLVGD